MPPGCLQPGDPGQVLQLLREDLAEFEHWSGKAKRAYLFVVVWAVGSLPVRLVKTGSAFDALMILRPTADHEGIRAADLRGVAGVVQEELEASRLLADVLFRRKHGSILRRRFEMT